MAGYQRQSAADIVPTAVVRAAPINNELNALRDAFVLAGGHRHDGSSTEGAHVPLIADADALNKVAVDTTNNRIGAFVEVGGAAVEQVRIQDGAIVPVTTADIDLGTNSLKFKSAFLSGTAAVDVLTATTSASIPSLTVGTSAVIASADINAGTIDGAVIGGSSAQAITGTTITATTGFVGGLTGAVTGNTAGTHTGAVVGNVTGNVTGNITAASGTSTFNDVTINGGLNMVAGTSATITNLSSPTNAGDAATKGYVDTSISNLIDASPGTLDTLNELAAALGDDPNFATTVTNSIATKLPLAGGTMSGAIAMGTNKITGLGTPTATTDAATKTYVDTADALKLSLSGGTMSGAIAMGTSKITGLGTPTADADATTKLYVDGILGSATAAATSAAAAATSASNAATSASNASTSASNASTSAGAASTSATAAAASYDAFDDRYLGSKTSAPSVDNDGNALLTGALYWNSTSSELYLWTGSAWTRSALSGVDYVAKTGDTMTGALAVSVTDNSNAAVRITQLGTGNALLVEDSANPDSTPFVVNAGGNVIVGNTSSLATAPANASPLFQVHRSSSNVNFASAGITNWVATSAGSGLQLSKSRSATIGTFGIVSSNDAIGRVQFNADDGTQFLAAVNIEAQVDGTPGTNDMPGRLLFSTTAGGASAPTERMRISSTGQTTFSGNAIISTTDNTNAALRITQLGTGNALLVEDSANPDASPFVVDNSGRAVVGATAIFPGIFGNSAPFEVASTSVHPVQFARFANDAFGSDIQILKSRNATPGGQTIAQNGDSIGALYWGISDGTNYIPAASILSQVDGTPGTNDMPGRLVFGTTADGASTPTERMRISSTGQTTFSGNAIISTTDNTNAALRITQLGTGNALLVEDSTNPDATPFVVRADGVVLAGKLTPSTNVATTTPQFQIHTNIASEGWSSGTSFNWSASNQGAGFNFAKSRSGTVGTQTIVQSGDNLGVNGFYGDDGANFVIGASISAAVDGTPGTNDMPGRLVFGTTADGASTPTERVRIDSAGNVGFGTSSLGGGYRVDILPAAGGTALRVRGGSGGSSTIQFTDNAESAQWASIATTTASLLLDHAAVLRFSTASSERMRINSSGNVGIGNTNPTQKLDVTGSIKFSGATYENVFTITDGASVDLDPANGTIQLWTLGASRSPTATNFAAGQSMTLMVADGTAYTITWPSVTWVGGTAPTLALTGYTVIELWEVGTTLYGALVGNVA